MHQGISLMCHCEGALRPWQSRRTWLDDRVPPAKSQLPSRDCTPRALPRASRSGRRVGLRPPRNDKPSAFTVLLTAGFLRRCSAGPGCPLPYKEGAVDDVPPDL